MIFSTKDREPFINSEVRPHLHGFLANSVRNTGCQCYRVGGTADHVHLAIRLTRTIEIAKLLDQIKTPSSSWMKSQGHEFKGFTWQRGYGCFSVGPKSLDPLRKYIDEQHEHHRFKTFKEEYLQFLEQYEMEYDERYLWD
ncbi:MAG: transposase [Candidatus Sumerlaeota bacterium]